MGAMDYLRSLIGLKATSKPARGRPSTDERITERTGVGLAGRINLLPYYREDGSGDGDEVRRAMRKMLREPFVKAAWCSNLLTVASQDFQVHASDKRDPESRRQADFVRDAIELSDNGMVDVVTSILNPMGPDGYSICEKVWQPIEHGPHRGMIALRALKPKHPDRAMLIIDRYENVTGVRSRLEHNVYPISDFTYCRYLPQWNEPDGIAPYRAAYGAYWMLDTVRKLRMIHHERKIGGLLLGTYTDPADQAALEAVLSKAGKATWATVPEGTRVEAMQISTASDTEYKAYIEDLRVDIVTAITFASLQILQGSVPDARGDSKVQKSISDLAPWYLTYLVTQVINRQLIPDIINYNFGEPVGGYPRASFGAVSATEIQQSISVVQAAIQIGLKPSRKHYAEEWGIQEADPNDPSDALGAPAPGGMPGMMGGMGGGMPDPFAGLGGGGGGGGGLPASIPGNDPMAQAGQPEGYFAERFAEGDWQPIGNGLYQSAGGRTVTEDTFRSWFADDSGLEQAGRSREKDAAGRYPMTYRPRAVATDLGQQVADPAASRKFLAREVLSRIPPAYQPDVSLAIAGMPDRAAQLAATGVSGFQQFEDRGQFIEAIRRQYGAYLDRGQVDSILSDADRMAAAYLPHTRAVLLGPVGGLPTAPSWTVLHEMAHAVDHGGRLSASPEWQSAWQQEIAHGSLTNYAGTNPKEGFAELSAIVWGRRADLAEVEQLFPAAAAYFRKNKLWPANAPEKRPGFFSRVLGSFAERNLLPDVFGQRVELPGGGHLDVSLPRLAAPDKFSWGEDDTPHIQTGKRGGRYYVPNGMPDVPDNRIYVDQEGGQQRAERAERRDAATVQRRQRLGARGPEILDAVAEFFPDWRHEMDRDPHPDATNEAEHNFTYIEPATGARRRLYMQDRKDGGVEIDFMMTAANDRQVGTDGPMVLAGQESHTTSNKTLQPGSKDFARAMGYMIGRLTEKGIPIVYTPSDKRRMRAYERVLVHQNYHPAVIYHGPEAEARADEGKIRWQPIHTIPEHARPALWQQYQQILAGIEEKLSEEWEEWDSFSWRPATSRTGKAKAIWTGGGKRKPLYGDAATAALQEGRQTRQTANTQPKPPAGQPAPAEPEPARGRGRPKKAYDVEPMAMDLVNQIAGMPAEKQSQILETIIAAISQAHREQGAARTAVPVIPPPPDNIQVRYEQSGYLGGLNDEMRRAPVFEPRVKPIQGTATPGPRIDVPPPSMHSKDRVAWLQNEFAKVRGSGLPVDELRAKMIPILEVMSTADTAELLKGYGITPGRNAKVNRGLLLTHFERNRGGGEAIR
jgi:hypothetical protein